MGSMSASDAAPLPRLGEVYFDVRGESRSMRLSWYADTGVAVFSIWQGGTCTGTFRLPIADLPRMIDTLQRGPHGDAGEAGGPHDDPRATELHNMPGQHSITGQHSLPGQHGRTGHGPGHAAGQYDPGIPAAAGSPEGYGRTGAHGRYEETRAVHPDEGMPGGAGGYREERGGSYRDEPPTGVYRGDLLSREAGGGRRPDRHGGHQDDLVPTGYGADLPGGHRDDPPPGGYEDDPLSGGYRDNPRDGAGHRGDPPPGGYEDDPLSGGYRDNPRDGAGHRGDPPPGGYEDDPLSGGYRDEPRGPYRADSLPGGYRADLPGGHHDDPLPASYGDESHSGRRRVDRRGGDYSDDPLTGGYPDDPVTGGYPDDPRGGYAEEPATARYRPEPPTGDYPTGPPDSAIDDPAHPAPAGYSPARPYVAPVPGGTRGTGQGQGRERRRGGDREESDLSPDSFPYGYPPAEPDVRGRRR